jgi:hypothetical protein
MTARETITTEQFDEPTSPMGLPPAAFPQALY